MAQTQSNNAVKNFSFSAYSGIVPGIRLHVGVPTSHNDGSVFAPHVKCGERFAAINRSSPPQMKKTQDGTFVYTADVDRIVPRNGSPFYTLCNGAGSKALLLYVDPKVVAKPHMKLKVDPSAMRAWNGVLCEDGVQIAAVDNRSGVSLLRFPSEGKSVFVYHDDGSITRITRKWDEFEVSSVDPEVTAELRVFQFRGQLEGLSDSEDDVKRKHGVLGGAIRLLQTTKKYPKARRVLVGFLREFADGDLLYQMMLDVRKTLLDWNDPEAVFFISEGPSKIIDLATKKSPSAKPHNNKAERRARDQELRAKMRGGASGGGRQESKQGKKGK
jgi:hypothetical protein